MTIARYPLNLPPFQQGGLDSLCGLYSIVNAERFINHTSDDEAVKLFNDIVKYLSKKRMLAKFLIGGMRLRHMTMVLRDVVGDRIVGQHLPWAGIPNPDLDTFWKSLQGFLDGTPHRSVILGLDGFHDHWTVIESITDKGIFLYDSALIGNLTRTSCTMSKSTGKRRTHWLQPAQTYFLSNEEDQ